MEKNNIKRFGLMFLIIVVFFMLTLLSSFAFNNLILHGSFGVTENNSNNVTSTSYNGSDFSSEYISSVEVLVENKSIVVNPLVQNSLMYSDLTHTFGKIPARYVGAEYILGENALYSVKNDVYSITVEVDCSVIVMYRASSNIPAWIIERGFEYSNNIIMTSNSIMFKIYEKQMLANDSVILGESNETYAYDNMYVAGVCVPITNDLSTSPISEVYINNIKCNNFMGDTFNYYMGEITQTNVMPTSELQISVTEKSNYKSHSVSFNTVKNKIELEVVDITDVSYKYVFSYAFYSEEETLSGSYLTNIVSLSNTQSSDVNLAYLYVGENVYADSSVTFTNVPYQFSSADFLQISSNNFNYIYSVTARENCYLFALISASEAYIIGEGENGWARQEMVCVDSNNVVYIMWTKYLAEKQTYVFDYNKTESLTILPMLFGAKSAKDVDENIFFSDAFNNIDENTNLPVGWDNDGSTPEDASYYPSSTAKATITYEDKFTNNNGIYNTTNNLGGYIHDTDGYIIFEDKSANIKSEIQGEKCYINKEFSPQSGLFEISVDVFAYSKNTNNEAANTMNDGSTPVMNWFRIVLTKGLMSGGFVNSSKANYGPETYLNGGDDTYFNIIGRKAYSTGSVNLITNLPYDTWIKLTYIVDTVSQKYKVKAEYDSISETSSSTKFVGPTEATTNENIDYLSNLGIGSSANCKNKIAVKNVIINQNNDDVIDSISANGVELEGYNQLTYAYIITLDRNNTLPIISATLGSNADENSLSISETPVNSIINVSATRTVSNKTGTFNYRIYLYANTLQLESLVNATSSYYNTGLENNFDANYETANQLILNKSHNYNQVTLAYTNLLNSLLTEVQTYSAEVVNDGGTTKADAYILNYGSLVENQVVPIYIELNNGYDIDTIEVTNESDEIILCEYNPISKMYEFIMPAENVIVNITYKPASLIIYIPDGVVVFTDNDQILSNGDYITKNQLIRIFYTDSPSYDEILLVNGVDCSNGEEIIVDDENIVIQFSLGSKLYSITTQNISNGESEVVPNTELYSDLEIITITTIPASNYETLSIEVLDDNNNHLEYNTISSNQFSFIMPKSNVTIIPHFTTLRYSITTTPDTITNGTWAVMETRAHVNDLISVSYTSENNNYVVNKAYYIFDNSEEIHIINLNNNTFLMPNGNITLYAELGYRESVLFIPAGVSIVRNSSLKNDAPLGALSNGDIVYARDVLVITHSVPTGYYQTSELSVTGATFDNGVYTLNNKSFTVSYGIALIEIQSIQIKTNPTKLNYYAFDTLNLNGAIIQAYFNNSEEPVNFDNNNIQVIYTNNGSHFLAGETSVILKYTYSTGTSKEVVLHVDAVQKLLPSISDFNVSNIVFGQSINNSTISGGVVSGGATFAWDSSDALLTPNVLNANTFTVIVTVLDADNYDFEALELTNWNSDNKTFEVEKSVVVEKRIISTSLISVVGSKQVDSNLNAIVFTNADMTILGEYNSNLQVSSINPKDKLNNDIISVGDYEVLVTVELTDTDNYIFSNSSTEHSLYANVKVLPNPILQTDINAITCEAYYNHGAEIVLSSSNFKNVLPCIEISSIGDFLGTVVQTYSNAVQITLTAKTGYMFDIDGDGEDFTSSHTLTLSVNVLPFVITKSEIEVSAQRVWSGSAIVLYNANDFILNTSYASIINIKENSNTTVGEHNISVTLLANDNYIFEDNDSTYQINAILNIIPINITLTTNDIEYIGSHLYSGEEIEFSLADFNSIENTNIEIEKLVTEDYVLAGDYILKVIITAHTGYTINNKNSETFEIVVSIEKINIEVSSNNFLQITEKLYTSEKIIFNKNDFYTTLNNISINNVLEVEDNNYINAGEYVVSLNIVPANNNYLINNKLSDLITVGVKILKANSEITTVPTITNIVYIGQTLNDVIYSEGVGFPSGGTFTIKEPLSQILQSSNAVTFVYTPNSEDLNNYVISERAQSFSAVKLSLVFNSNFGVPITKTQDIRFNTNETLDANTFERVGYTFLKWCNTQDGEGECYLDGAIFKTNVTENNVLYAIWQANNTNIVLNKNNKGLANGSVTATYNSNTLINSRGVSETGYVLQGYFTEATNGIKVISARFELQTNVVGYTDANSNWIYLNSNLTLYAQWEPATNIVFTTEHYFENLNGEFVFTDIKTFGYGTTDTQVSAIALTGSNLPTGFEYDNNNASEIKNGIVLGNGELLLKLYYKRIIYTVLWKVDNTVIETDYVKYESTPSYDGETPTKQQTEQFTYQFSGWNPNINSTIITQNTIFEAQFLRTTNQYDATFVRGGNINEIFISINASSTTGFNSGTMFDFGSNLFLIIKMPENTMAKTYIAPTGFTQRGDSLYYTKSITIGVLNDFGQINGTSKTNKYAINFYDSNNILIESVSVFYNDSISNIEFDIPTIEETGYDITFDGWVTELNGDVIDDLSNVVQDRNVYAKYLRVAEVYDITYSNIENATLEDGSPLTHTFGSTTILKNARKFDYDFIGWSKTVDGEVITEISPSEITSDITLYANFVQSTYQIQKGPEVNGTFSFSGIAKTGNTITVNPIAHENCDITNIYYVKENESAQNQIQKQNNVYSFEMVSSNITIFVVFEFTYSVTIDCGINGSYTINPNKNKFLVDEVVTLTINPNTNYVLDSVNSEQVELVGDGLVKIFVVIAEDIIISITFKTVTIVISDNNELVEIEAESDVIPQNSRVEINEINSENSDYSMINNSINKISNKFTVFNIEVFDSSNSAISGSLNDSVIIKIKIPSNYDQNNIEVFRIDDDGTKTKYEHTIVSGFAQIVINHFSYYVIAEILPTETGPETDDDNNILIILIVLGSVLVVGIIVVLIILKRKSIVKQNQKIILNVENNNSNKATKNDNKLIDKSIKHNTTQTSEKNAVLGKKVKQSAVINNNKEKTNSSKKTPEKPSVQKDNIINNIKTIEKPNSVTKTKKTVKPKSSEKSKQVATTKKTKK